MEWDVMGMGKRIGMGCDGVGVEWEWGGIGMGWD